jgi:ribosomal-protein-alanine N-acetyltransferase
LAENSTNSAVAPIETARLRLRPPRPSDLDDVFAYMGDPVVMKYRACGAQTREQTSQWLNRIVESAPAHRGFVGRVLQIALKPSDRVIGYCYLDVPWPEGYRELLADDPGDFADLTYGLAQAHWGSGYATEAAGALVTHAFQNLGLPRIGASVNPANMASIHVLEHIGLMYRRCFNWPGQGTVHFYSATREEWEPPEPD